MSAYYIPDTSPLFAYSPCTNCAERGGWQAAYSPRGDGYDQTFHQAASANSTVSLNLTGAVGRSTREGGVDDQPSPSSSGQAWRMGNVMRNIALTGATSRTAVPSPRSLVADTR
jgi:hypothetical protein